MLQQWREREDVVLDQHVLYLVCRASNEAQCNVQCQRRVGQGNKKGGRKEKKQERKKIIEQVKSRTCGVDQMDACGVEQTHVRCRADARAVTRRMHVVEHVV